MTKQSGVSGGVISLNLRMCGLETELVGKVLALMREEKQHLDNDNKEVE